MGLAEKITNNLKWRTLLENLVQVLHINVCIVDPHGQSIITPNKNPFGWKLLADSFEMISRSNLSGEWQEWVDDLKLHHFVMSIGNHSKPQAYIVLGPVILNKKLEKSQYQQLASGSNRNFDDLQDSLEGIRVVSYTNLKYITDLIQGVVELAQETASELFVPVISVDRDGLRGILQSMLELSLGIAKAQSGSIMLFDLKTNELSVQAAKGLAGRYFKKSVKLNEGIAGLAFREKKTLILTDRSKDNRIDHLLNRKEIKHSIVMPFEEPTKEIRGVLSLNIINETLIVKKSELRHITERLSQITSNALQSI